MRNAIVFFSLCLLTACARSAIKPDFATQDAAIDSRDAATDGSAQPARDAASEDGGPDEAGQSRPDSGDTVSALCTSSLKCENAVLLGTVDASDAKSSIVQQGKGSGWFAIDVSDGNLNATGTIRIGVGVKLSAPSGSTYAVSIMGDTGPDGAGRCVAADVTDTDPLGKTAIWGSFGPTTARKRELALHVEHLSGPCDQTWTLTVTGSPCPAGGFGFGQASMGSCR